jgi:hypothetical protein
LTKFWAFWSGWFERIERTVKKFAQSTTFSGFNLLTQLNPYQRKMPAYPIPATLIGKLTVDNPVKGQGLGGELLAHALYRIVRASQEIGIFAVRVDAIALQAKKFYSNTSLFPFKIKNYPFFKPAFGAETLRVRVGRQSHLFWGVADGY